MNVAGADPFNGERPTAITPAEYVAPLMSHGLLVRVVQTGRPASWWDRRVALPATNQRLMQDGWMGITIVQNDVSSGARRSRSATRHESGDFQEVAR